MTCIDLPQENCDRRAKWLNETLVMACDIASERVRFGDRQRSKYWWSDEISEYRRVCVARRRLTQAKKRDNLEGIEILSSRYKEARRQLRTSIKKAKTASWGN